MKTLSQLLQRGSHKQYILCPGKFDDMTGVLIDILKKDRINRKEIIRFGI